MAIFSRSLTGEEALSMELPVAADTYVVGEWMALGATDGTDLGAYKSGAGVVTGIAGVCNTAATTTGNADGYDYDTCDITINPFGVYEAIYSQTSPISLSAEFAFACTSGKGHPNLGGGWVYGVVDPGAGELNMVEDSSVTTTTCTLVLADTPTATRTSSSDVILIYPIGQYGVILGDTDIAAGDLDCGDTTAGGTDGLAVNIIENYISSDTRNKQPLRWGGTAFGQGSTIKPKTDIDHVGLTDLDSDSAEFTAEICLFRGGQFNADLGLS